MARNAATAWTLPIAVNGAACVGARASYRRDLSLHGPSGGTRTGLSISGVLWRVRGGAKSWSASFRPRTICTGSGWQSRLGEKVFVASSSSVDTSSDQLVVL